MSISYNGITPFIVFEGVDNSGKTTISKIVAEKYTQFVWKKEPVFTTEMADKLNSPDSNVSDAEREVMFLEGRLKQQEVYRSSPVLLDRYLWTGMAYAKAFSPSIYDFCVALYQNYRIFRKPTVTIFMETPLETCQSREPSLTMERLETLRQAYRDTEKYVNTPIEYVDGTQSIDQCVEAVIDIMRKYAPYHVI